MLAAFRGIPRRQVRAAPAFTLVEVLVVVAVISMLAALTVPALHGAHDSARRTVCAGRMTQPSALLRMFTTDHDDVFPRTQDPSYGVAHPSYDPSVSLDKTWVDLLTAKGYLEANLERSGLPESLMCPSAHGYDNDPTWAGQMPHFGVNVSLNPPKRLEATMGQRSFFGRPFLFSGDHASKIMLAESKQLNNLRGWYSVGNSNWVDARHGLGKGANVVYLDGHVAFRKLSETSATAEPTEPFAGINFWRQPIP